jgi:hypothetical protein
MELDLDLEETILQAIRNAAQTMMFVKNTLNLVSAVLTKGSNAANIPIMLALNEHLMVTALKDLKGALGQLQKQDHPSIQVLAETIAHMETSLYTPILGKSLA